MTSNTHHLTASELDALIGAAIDAGAVILEIRARGHTVETKADSSPVTEADRAAEALIAERIAVSVPAIPMVGEEATYDGDLPDVGERFFLVDPLDGTREFTRGGDDFTVNIGLIVGGEPVAGVIFVPATGRLFWGIEGEGAWHADVVDGARGVARPLGCREAPSDRLVVVASRSHRTPETDAFIDRFGTCDIVAAGSSLKFCTVAEGDADLYPRMGPTMQWDTAAGDAILRAAGGRVVDLDGTPLGYGPIAGADGPDRFRNPYFVATGGMDPFPPGEGSDRRSNHRAG